MIITHLLWADDLVIISLSSHSLQNSLKILEDYCKKWRLIINKAKTKVVIFNENIPENLTFQIDDEKIDKVTDYKYLGEIQSSDNDNIKHIQYIADRSTKACFNMRRYYKLFGDIPIKTALHLFDTCILPISLLAVQINLF